MAVATIIRCDNVITRFTQCSEDIAVMAISTIHHGTAKGAKYARTVVNRCSVEAATRRGMTLPAHRE